MSEIAELRAEVAKLRREVAELRARENPLWWANFPPYYDWRDLIRDPFYPYVTAT